MRRHTVLVAMLAALLAADAFAQPTRTQTPYAKLEGVDPNLTSLDVYAPKDGKDCPVLVFIHGGAWQGGDKSAVGVMPRYFTRAGFAFVSVNYRLAPAAKHPAQIEDVAKAIAWVHAHAAEFGGDPAKLFVMGHSAGAHLAALLATDARRLKAEGLDLWAIRGAVILDTEAYDLPALAKRFGGTLPEVWSAAFSQPVPSGVEGDAKVWADASPVTYVARGIGIPPMLIVYSGGMAPAGKPEPERATDAEAFAKRLRDAGVPAEVLGAPDKSHSQLAGEFGDPNNRVTERTMAFLRRLLANPPPSKDRPAPIPSASE